MHIGSHRQVRVAGRMVADEPAWLRGLLILAAVLVVTWLIVVPLVYVFYQALKPGLAAYLEALTADPDTVHAIWLTLTVAPVSVFLNTIFGITAAWLITRFQFPGRALLVTLLDIPFAISPIVVGLMFLLLFGQQGYWGPTLREWGIEIAWAWPGIVIATTFVTMPFVARELIPLMQALGSDEELAAVSLGANPWQLFWRVTLPNIRWALLFGIIQCNARAIGEFGAVYVISGHIVGQTDTMPQRVEKLYQEYHMPEAFALASLLALMALLTIVGKFVLEHWIARSLPDPNE